MKVTDLIKEYENRKEAHEKRLLKILQKESYTQKDCDDIFEQKVAISMTNEFLKSLKQLV